MKGVMNAYWRALRTDPRFAACLAAILLLLTDDVPQPQYSTFWDPGGALLLSLSCGNCVGLFAARGGTKRVGWVQLSILFFLGLILKSAVQSALYIQNAGIVDSVLFLIGQGCTAAFASRDVRWQSVSRRVVSGSAVAILAILVVESAFYYTRQYEMGFAPEFFVFAILRAAMPYAFWTAVLPAKRLNLPGAG